MFCIGYLKSGSTKAALLANVEFSCNFTGTRIQEIEERKDHLRQVNDLGLKAQASVMTPKLRLDKLDPEPSLPYIYYDCVRLYLTNVSLVIWSIASQYLFRVPKDPSRHWANVNHGSLRLHCQLRHRKGINRSQHR